MSDLQVLLVADDTVVTETTRAILRRLGYQVVVIAAAEEHLSSQISHTPPAIILVDTDTPAGERLAEHVRAAVDIPLLFLTGRARADHPVEYLVRPVTERDLDRAIRMTLHTHALERQVREAEQQIQTLRQQVHEAGQHKSNFLASMSHELRTPLNAMIGYTSLTLNALKDSLPQDHVQNLTRAEQSARMLLQLINDVLDLSKIEAGKMQLLIEEIELRDVLEDVMTTAEGLVADKPLTLQADFPQDLPVIASDYTRLKQILDNLVGNAIKFTARGFVAVRVLPQAEPHTIRIAVADSGAGIPPEFRSGLFELFRQVDGSIRKKFGGTGLGLAITKRLSDMLGIRIDVTSQVNAGTTFWLDVPITFAQPAAPQEKHAEAAPAVKAAILCFCDQPACAALQRQLAGFPFEVAPVSTVAECVEKAATLPVWAIVMETDARSAPLLTQLHAEPALRRTRILTPPPCRRAETTDQEFNARVADIVRALTLAGTYSILVVDDNEMNLHLMGNLLRSAGCTVYQATSGHEGLAVARRTLPDAIVMDVAMPDMDGFEATARLKQQPETAAITVIACSAFTAREYQDKARQAGCEGYITKPIEPQRLVEQVTRFIIAAKIKRIAPPA